MTRHEEQIRLAQSRDREARAYRERGNERMARFLERKAEARRRLARWYQRADAGLERSAA